MSLDTDFFDLEFGRDRDAQESHISSTCLPHLDELIQLKSRLLGVHAAFHVLGAADGPEHDRVLKHLDRVNTYIARGFQSIWN